MALYLEDFAVGQKYGLEIHAGIRRWLEFKALDETLLIEGIIAKYEQQEKDLIHFESWMLL